MYRKQIIDEMKAVQQEYAVAAHAVAALRLRLNRAKPMPGDVDLSDLAVRRCAQHLDATYYIRLFAVFEESLRQVWEVSMEKKTRPKTEDLLNGCAARRDMEHDILREAHEVRDYRNMLVHGGNAATVTLDEAIRRLCLFFSRMPPQW